MTKNCQKKDRSIAISSIFRVGVVYFRCLLVNPHVQAAQNMSGKGGRRYFRPSYRRPKFTLFFKKREANLRCPKKCISQNLKNWACKLKSLLAIDYGKKFGSSNSKIVGDTFFWTPHNFANGPHFVALTQLQATKTGSKICCTHLSYTFSESWVR